jgi:HEPN domain-containing protein
MNVTNPIVGEWIYLSQRDYEAALTLAECFRPFIEGVCYHCQQSAEKILKAYLIANDEIPPKTHDLTTLIARSKQYLPDFDNYAKPCNTLTMYASDTRYPPRLSLTETDMKQAIKDATQILEFTKAKLKELGYEYSHQSS